MRPFTFRNDGDGNADEVRIRATIPEALTAIAETVTLNGHAVAVDGLLDLCLRDLIVGGSATIAFDMFATAAAGGYLEAVDLKAECETAALEMQALFHIEPARTVDARSISYAEIAEARDEPLPRNALPLPVVLPDAPAVVAEAALSFPTSIVPAQPEPVPFAEPGAALPIAFAPEAPEEEGSQEASIVIAGTEGAASDREDHASGESDVYADQTVALGQDAGREPAPANEDEHAAPLAPAAVASTFGESAQTPPGPVVPIAAIAASTALAGAAAARLDQTFASSAAIIVDREKPNGHLQALALRALFPAQIDGSEETQAAYDVVRKFNAPIVKRKISTLLLDTYTPNESWLLDLISPDLHDALRSFLTIAQHDATLDPVIAENLRHAVVGEPPFADAPVNDPRATGILLALVDASLVTPSQAVADYRKAFYAEVANGWTLAYPNPKALDDAFASILAGVAVRA